MLLEGNEVTVPEQTEQIEEAGKTVLATLWLMKALLLRESYR
jgi:hypothetical protein